LTIYNKAIRDKIPEIIRASGHDLTVKILNDDEFLSKLEEKLVEELQEYQESKSVEELADILEVIYRISELKGTTKEQLDELKQKKSQERGAFKDNLFLIDTKNSE
jgi:predicted house-cleaning noncanonical NTP pyrophosphatase (MazG superfamily)